jgi:golgi phosphoprotein 3
MKPQDSTLPLQQAVLLIALRDREGTIVGGTMYQYALGGAIASELLLSGRAAVEPEKKKNFLRAAPGRPLGDPELDEALAMLADARRRATIEQWISKFAGIKQLRHRIAERLCRAGILRADEDQVLGIFSRKTYPEVDPRPEKQLIERIRRAVLSDSDEIDPRTVVLVALLKHSGLIKVVFDRAEIKARKARIEQIAKGDVVGKAVKNAIDAVHAAVFAAAIIPAICASH